MQKGRHRVSGEERAVKIMDKRYLNPEEKKRLKNEIDIMKTLDHPNIVRLYEVFEDEKFIYLVQEICTGGELFDELIKRK